MASVVAHGLLFTAHQPELRWRAVAPNPAGAPIMVRLAPAPDRAPDSSPAPEPKASRPPSTLQPPDEAFENANSDSADSGQGRISASVGATSSQKSSPGFDSTSSPGASSLPLAPDLNYYAARDLDSYPRLLTPLRIDRAAESGASEVRLEILIDERGVVRDITFSGSAEPGGEHEALRDALAATPFFPATKGGRAVKSRIVISVSLPAAGDR